MSSLMRLAGDVLGYAEQSTQCCNCSSFIKVFDAANHLIYTLQGQLQPQLPASLLCCPVICDAVQPVYVGHASFPFVVTCFFVLQHLTLSMFSALCDNVVLVSVL